jgi:uncharacterized protein (DUF302 family)
MFGKFVKFGLLSLLAAGITAAGPARAQSDDGIVRLRSAYPTDETIMRLKRDIAAKGIMFFSEIDQARLAADAGVSLPLRRSTLLIFGNPGLGTQFIQGRPEAGIDWPVRLLVQEDNAGNVWASYTDFGWIARRHGIGPGKDGPFNTATGVIGSIASSVQAK